MRLSTRPNPGADREKAKPVRQAARAIDRSQGCANDTQAKVDLLGEARGMHRHLRIRLPERAARLRSSLAAGSVARPLPAIHAPVFRSRGAECDAEAALGRV